MVVVIELVLHEACIRVNRSFGLWFHARRMPLPGLASPKDLVVDLSSI